MRRGGEGDRRDGTAADGGLGDAERDLRPGGLAVLSCLFSTSLSLGLSRSPPRSTESPALEGASGGTAVTLLGEDAGGGLGLSIWVGL